MKLNVEVGFTTTSGQSLNDVVSRNTASVPRATSSPSSSKIGVTGLSGEMDQENKRVTKSAKESATIIDSHFTMIDDAMADGRSKLASQRSKMSSDDERWANQASADSRSNLAKIRQGIQAEQNKFDTGWVMPWSPALAQKMAFKKMSEQEGEVKTLESLRDDAIRENTKRRQGERGGTGSTELDPSLLAIMQKTLPETAKKVSYVGDPANYERNILKILAGSTLPEASKKMSEQEGEVKTLESLRDDAIRENTKRRQGERGGIGSTELDPRLLATMQKTLPEMSKEGAKKLARGLVPDAGDLENEIGNRTSRLPWSRLTSGLMRDFLRQNGLGFGSSSAISNMLGSGVVAAAVGAIGPFADVATAATVAAGVKFYTSSELAESRRTFGANNSIAGLDRYKSGAMSDEYSPATGGFYDQFENAPGFLTDFRKEVFVNKSLGAYAGLTPYRKNFGEQSKKFSETATMMGFGKDPEKLAELIRPNLQGLNESQQEEVLPFFVESEYRKQLENRGETTPGFALGFQISGERNTARLLQEQKQRGIQAVLDRQQTEIELSKASALEQSGVAQFSTVASARLSSQKALAGLTSDPAKSGAALMKSSVSSEADQISIVKQKAQMLQDDATNAASAYQKAQDSYMTAYGSFAFDINNVRKGAALTDVQMEQKFQEQRPEFFKTRQEAQLRAQAAKGVAESFQESTMPNQISAIQSAGNLQRQTIGIVSNYNATLQSVDAQNKLSIAIGETASNQLLLNSSLTDDPTERKTNAINAAAESYRNRASAIIESAIATKEDQSVTESKISVLDEEDKQNRATIETNGVLYSSHVKVQEIQRYAATSAGITEAQTQRPGVTRLAKASTEAVELERQASFLHSEVHALPVGETIERGKLLGQRAVLVQRVLTARQQESYEMGGGTFSLAREAAEARRARRQQERGERRQQTFADQAEFDKRHGVHFNDSDISGAADRAAGNKTAHPQNEAPNVMLQAAYLMLQAAGVIGRSQPNGNSGGYAGVGGNPIPSR